MGQRKITDDLDALLQVLPPRVEEAVRAANHGDDLLEIVMDLGRCRRRGSWTTSWC